VLLLVDVACALPRLLRVVGLWLLMLQLRGADDAGAGAGRGLRRGAGRAAGLLGLARQADAACAALVGEGERGRVRERARLARCRR
jgi:hypothetical protein